MEKYTPITINDKGLPSLFQAADNASIRSQRIYLWLFRINLILTVLAACLAIIQFTNLTAKIWLSILGAVLLLLVTVSTVVLRFVKLEKTWFDGRAVAESVKTLTWRYVTCANPYNADLTPKEVDDRFVSHLKLILDERKDLGAHLSVFDNHKPQITSTMRNARALSLTDRKNLYLSQRIEHQKSWYSEKAEYNRNASRNWFITIILCQIFALLSAFYLALFPLSAIKLTSLFTTLSSSFIAWFQIKQHQELSQAYSIAAQELGLIFEQGKHLETEENLSAYVSDSENAISREHTLWVARKDRRYVNQREFT